MPKPGDDRYFGGGKGAARKAYDAMMEKYGERGEEVYFRTLNKRKAQEEGQSRALRGK